jgi:hypothetical protein
VKKEVSKSESDVTDDAERNKKKMGLKGFKKHMAKNITKDEDEDSDQPASTKDRVKKEKIKGKEKKIT